MSRLIYMGFKLLEPYEGKLSRTVLRGESGSNPADLPDKEPGLGFKRKITIICQLFRDGGPVEIGPALPWKHMDER